MKICHKVDVGLMGYAEAWELQKRLVAARKIDAIEDVLLLCEHPHVITLGRNGKRENLLASEQGAAAEGRGVSCVQPRRGHYLSRAGAVGGVSDFEPGRDS